MYREGHILFLSVKQQDQRWNSFTIQDDYVMNSRQGEISMTVILEKDYPQEAATMAKLCGFTYSGILPAHLNSVYAVTEAKWEENVQRLVEHNTHIKYLVIGEAAPETMAGEVSYFYNNCHGNWCKALVDGIIPWQQVPAETEEKFRELARRQFLLADTMPFAINYSVANRRNKKAYKELVGMCANSYLRRKLFDQRLKWADEVKLAFGVKKNAMAMMEAFPNGFSLPNGQIIKFSLDLVATTEANYPHAAQIRRVFGLA